MNKPKHLLHKIRDNDDGHYEKIGYALLMVWDDSIEAGSIAERVTDYHQSLLYDSRTTVMKYIEGSNLLQDWQLLTEDQKFGCSDLIVKDFLVEHAFSLQTGNDRAKTGRHRIKAKDLAISNTGHQL